MNTDINLPRTQPHQIPEKTVKVFIFNFRLSVPSLIFYDINFKKVSNDPREFRSKSQNDPKHQPQKSALKVIKLNLYAEFFA